MRQWVAALASKAAAARAQLAARLESTAFPLDYHTTLRVLRDELASVSPPPVVVSEGANTMDNARWVFARVWVWWAWLAG